MDGKWMANGNLKKIVMNVEKPETKKTYQEGKNKPWSDFKELISSKPAKRV
jgi:hypothetical protein